jgi:CRP/FNR family transcriptional regulator, nitrogen fixation regulation protein
VFARPKTLGELNVRLGTNATLSFDQSEYKKDRQIYSAGAPADYVYRIKKGAVRTYKWLDDGRRQIDAFHLEGDIFGLTSEDRHRFSAETIVETTVWLIKRQNFELADVDGALLQYLLGSTAQSLNHAEDHLLLLGRKSAIEKVAAFLLEMDQRLANTGTISLPMTRRDIADYLGLTLETVSRALSKLKKAGAISFAGNQQREINILSRTRLLALDARE